MYSIEARQMGLKTQKVSGLLENCFNGVTVPLVK